MVLTIIGGKINNAIT